MSQAQKTPFSTSIANFTSGQINDYLAGLGQVLPCTVVEVGYDGEGNSIVMVNFDVLPGFTLRPVTMPIIGSEYVRIPVQVGDSGIAISASVRIGNISGLGVPYAPSPLVAPSNLGALVFVPISSALWTPPLNPEALLLQGHDGVVIQDMLGDTTFTLTPAGIVVDAQTSVTVGVGSNTIVITAGGIVINGNVTVNGTINSTGDISAGSVTMQTHTHKVVGVQGGSSTITTSVGTG